VRENLFSDESLPFFGRSSSLQAAEMPENSATALQLAEKLA
jgi:hypothetical protein